MKEDGRLVIYSRKSRFTGKGESIENQIDMCRQYIRLQFGDAAADGALVYEDEGFSGGNLERPQFKKMMADAKKMTFRAVVVYRLDRISRNIGDFAKLIEELNRLEVGFISIKEQFDTSSPMGRAMMYISSVFSQLERETIAERIRDNMLELAKTGRWLGGTTPTGYESTPAERVTVDGKTRRSYQLVFQPGKIETVKLLYGKFLETGSLTKVETFLIQNNILSKNGKRYSRFTIRSILENPVYLIADRDAFRYFENAGVMLCSDERDFDGRFGIMAYNKTLQQHGKANRLRDTANWIVAIGKHQGILPGRDWVRVQEILERNRSKSYRKPKSSTALLSGLLRCGNCGSYMRPKLSKRKNAAGNFIYTYLCELKEKSHGQKCSMRNGNGNLLDEAVCGEIKKLSEDRSDFFRQLRAYRQPFENSVSKTGAELDRLNQSVLDNEKSISNLVAALGEAQGTSAAGYITKQINGLDAENSRLNARIAELSRFEKVQFLPDDQIGIIKNVLSSFSSAFDTMTVEEKRSALRTFIDKIVWDGETADIYLLGSGAEAVPLPPAPPSCSIPLCEDSK